ncbi:hypothetical protein [Pasteuria penetrans]|uniref:hypothetical protein n=1 Tax=Pasteuria penetrans TaxID=86005 RepID=UPI000F99ABAA|nr:hypothetical protein [Pasteuria penetrans]
MQDRSMIISERTEDVKFVKTDFKERRNIPGGTGDLFGSSFPIFSVSHPILHRETGDRVGYITQFWGDNAFISSGSVTAAKRARIAMAVISSDDTYSIYVFGENQVESFRFDKDGNLLDDKDKIIMNNYAGDFVEGGTAGSDRVKRFPFGSLCHSCTWIVDKVDAASSAGCVLGAIRLGRSFVVPWVMVASGLTFWAICDYIRTWGYPAAKHHFCSDFC